MRKEGVNFANSSSVDAWKRNRESLKKNGFLESMIQVSNEDYCYGADECNSTNIARLLEQNKDCCVYLSRNGMRHFNFKLNGTNFVDAKSYLDLRTIYMRPRDIIRVIAYGKEKEAAISKLESEISFVPVQRKVIPISEYMLQTA